MNGNCKIHIENKKRLVFDTVRSYGGHTSEYFQLLSRSIQTYFIDRTNLLMGELFAHPGIPMHLEHIPYSIAACNESDKTVSRIAAQTNPHRDRNGQEEDDDAEKGGVISANLNFHRVCH